MGLFNSRKRGVRSLFVYLHWEHVIYFKETHEMYVSILPPIQPPDLVYSKLDFPIKSQGKPQSYHSQIDNLQTWVLHWLPSIQYWLWILPPGSWTWLIWTQATRMSRIHLRWEFIFILLSQFWIFLLKWVRLLNVFDKYAP